MKNNKVSKILTIIATVISLIGLFFLIRIVMAGNDEIQESSDLQNSIVSPFIGFTQAVLYIAALAVVVYSVINLLKNPKALKKSLVMLAVLVVLLLIAYFPASDAAVTDVTGKIIKDGEAGSVSKWVSGLISFTGYLGIAGLAVILWGVVKGATK